MKRLFALSILTSIVLSGCQVDEPEINNVSEPKIFTAVIDDNYDGAPTKTSLDEHGNVLWMKGDQVSVFDGSTVNVQYQVTDDSDGKTSANLNKVTSSGYTAGTEISNNVAYYPYSSEIGIAKNGTCYTISGITLPATQTYAQASFANGAFPMAAITGSTEDNNLGFKNILGGLKLQLKGTAKIASISISGNADEILCGSANVTVSTTAVPEISLADASAKTVTLNCGTEGVQLNADTATPFIIALPPMTMASGFTVMVKDTDGKQMEIKTTKSQTIERSKLLKMPAVEYVGTESGGDSGEIDYLKEPFTITSVGETSVSFVKEGTPADITLEYRKNSEDWAAYTIGNAIALADGDALQFRAGEGGNSTFSQDLSNYYSIWAYGEGNVNISGNIMSLLDITLTVDDVPSYVFCRLFNNNKNNKLTEAANLKLPATTLEKGCYSNMFDGCTGLTTAPELPAMTLASYCYQYMFYGCTGLTTAPELPATTLAESCYNRMFYECKGLTTAPKLPATTLERGCYSNMFDGCTGLTTAPELPATTLAEYCYSNMFDNCSRLTTAPKLPATTLAWACYTDMFSGCFRLTTAPELPAMTLASECYSSMFSGCSRLTTAPKLPATTLALWCYKAMFRDCTGLTTAPELPATTLAEACYSFMFYGCTGLTTAPELPATTLTGSCYSYMFYGCLRLTTAPELPATTLAGTCYCGMFSLCSELNYVKALFTTIPSSDHCTNGWLSGVSSTGTFVKSKDATWDVTGTDVVPDGWTVVTE